MKRLFAKLEITDRQSFFDFCAQFLKFGLVGVSNTLISLAVYFIFIWMNRDLYLWGNIAGWVISVANAFYWNNRFVFKETKDSLLVKLGRTYLAYGGSFLLSTVLLYLQVDVLSISEIAAPIINLLVTIPLNFLINKFWTFRSKR